MDRRLPNLAWRLAWNRMRRHRRARYDFDVNDPGAFLPPAAAAGIAGDAASSDGSWLLSALVAISRHMLELPDLDHALRLTCEALQRASDLDRFWVIRYSHDEQAGFIAAEAHRPGLKALCEVIGPGPFAYAEYEEVFRPLLAGMVYSSPVAQKTGANHALSIATASRSDLFVPIIVEQRFWGAIGCDNCSHDRPFQAIEIDALRAAASAIASAVIRNQTEQARRQAEIDRADAAAEAARRLERHTRLLAAVATSAEELLAARDPDSCFEGVLRRVGEATSAIRAAMARIDWTPADPERHGWQTLGHEWTRPGVQRQSDTPMARFAMLRHDSTWTRCFAELRQSGRLLVEIDTLDEPFRSEQLALGVAWGVCYPLMIEGQIWGLLGFDFGCALDEFADADLAAMQTIASTISDALARHRLEQSRLTIEQARTRDALALNAVLEASVAASRALLCEEPFEAGLRRWLALMAETVGADRAAFGGFPGSSVEPSIALSQLLWTRPGVPSLAQVEVPPTADFVDFLHRLKREEAVYVGIDDLHDPRSRAHWQAIGCRANLLLPIRFRGQVDHWLCFDWSTEPAIDRACFAALRAACDGIVAALERHDVQRALLEEREVSLRQARLRNEELTLANAAMHSAIGGFGEDDDIDGFLERMLAATLPLAGAQSGAIALIDGETAYLPVLMGPQGRIPHAEQRHRGLDAVSLVAAEARRLLDALMVDGIDSVEVPNAAIRLWPRFVRFNREHGLQGLRLIPLRADQRLLGWLGLAFASRDAPVQRPHGLLRLLADQITVSLELLRLGDEAKSAAITQEREQAAREQAQQLTRANHVLRRSTLNLVGLHNVPDFLRALLREANCIVGARSAAIFTYDDATGALRMAYSVTDDRDDSIEHDPAMALWREPVPQAISAPWVERLRREDLVSFEVEADLEGHPWPISIAWHRARGHQRVIDIPLIVGGRLVGLFGLCFTRLDWPGTFKLEHARVMAQHASIALQIAQLAEDARRSAIIEQQALAAYERSRALEAANRALLDREVLLGAAAEASRLLLESADLSSALPLALERLGKAGGWSRTQLMLHEACGDGGSTHRVHAEWVGEALIDRLGSQRHRELPSHWLGDHLQRIRGGEPVWLIAGELPAATQRYFERLQNQTSAILPILVDGHYQGFVSFDDCERRRPYRLHEIDALSTAARVVASAMHRERLIDVVRRERESAARLRLQELTGANHTLQQTLDVLATETRVEQALGRVLMVLSERLGARSAALWLRVPGTADGVDVTDSAARSVDAAEPAHHARFAVHLIYGDGRIVDADSDDPVSREWPAGRDLRWKEHVRLRRPVVYDLDQMPDHGGQLRAFFEKLGVRGLLGVPLILGDEVIGTFTARFTDACNFGEEQLQLVQALAHQATLALRLRELSERSASEGRQSAVLAERNRIGREIHDGLAQNFTGLLMQIEAMEETLSGNLSPDIGGFVDKIKDLARFGLAEARRSVMALQPFQSKVGGLQSALQQLADRSAVPGRIRCVLSQPIAAIRLRPAIEHELFRIATEAVSNAQRHGRPSRIVISLMREADDVVLQVDDDGQGMAEIPTLYAHQGFGLDNMRERARAIGGRLDIDSRTGQGTRISVRIAADQAEAST